MGIFRNMLTIPLSWLYATGVSLRNVMFDWKILKSTEFDIPIVVVGNITVGGTGKTPFTEYLISTMSKTHNVAVLSRGYKRKSKGFVLASEGSSFKRIGDEPKQIKLKFPTVPVAVCEDRVKGINMLRELHPEVNLIILDDAFQHRYVEGWVNVVLMDYNHPVWADHMLPWGRLRDSRASLHRANMFVITKCPDALSPLDCRMVHKNIDPMPYQSIYYTNFASEPARPLFPELAKHDSLRRGHPAIILTGIANPRGFISYVETNFSLIDKMIFPDHYTFKMRDIYAVEDILKSSPEDTVVLLTEKDAVKLIGSRKISDRIKSRLYYISIKIEFRSNNEAEFNRIIEQYVRENQKHNITHPA